MSLLNYFFNRKEQNNDIDSSDEKPHSSVNPETKDEPAEETYEILEREILPTKIICPDCGGITLEGLEFCDKCGGEL